MINREAKIYSIICLVLVVLLFIGYVILPSSNKTSIKQSSLLNEKYIKTISEVSISHHDQTLLFEKDGNNWIGSTNIFNEMTNETTSKVVFPVASAKIDEYILALSIVRNIETVSTNASLWSNYALDNDSAIAVKLTNEDITKGGISILSELFFGNETFGGRRIFCRSSKTSTVYSINNDLYSWLKTDIKSWADLSLIPKVFTDNFSYTIRQSDLNVEYLSNARGSEITSEKVISRPDVSLVRTLQCDVGDGSRIDISFYSSETGQFYVKNETTNKKLSSYSYILEISKWTYDSLFTTE